MAWTEEGARSLLWPLGLLQLSTKFVSESPPRAALLERVWMTCIKGSWAAALAPDRRRRPVW